MSDFTPTAGQLAAANAITLHADKDGIVWCGPIHQDKALTLAWQRDRLAKGHADIIRHMELVVGGSAIPSTTATIALNALRAVGMEPTP